MHMSSQDGHALGPRGKQIMDQLHKNRLRDLFLNRAVKRGQFVLASGKPALFTSTANRCSSTPKHSNFWEMLLSNPPQTLTTPPSAGLK